MSFLASVLRAVYKLSGAKKSFALPEDKLLQEIEKQNRRARLSHALLADARHSLGDESHRPVSDRRLLGRPHEGVDDPRHGGFEALY